MNKLSLQPISRFFSFKHLMSLWYRHYKIMFFSGFVAVFLLAGYFWYTTLYQYQWSEERKREFIETHYKATAFKEKAFEQLVSGLKERAVRYNKPFPLSRDIFSGKSL